MSVVLLGTAIYVVLTTLPHIDICRSLPHLFLVLYNALVYTWQRVLAVSVK